MFPRSRKLSSTDIPSTTSAGMSASEELSSVMKISKWSWIQYSTTYVLMIILGAVGFHAPHMLYVWTWKTLLTPW